jgi:hypothetical protein
MFSRRILFSTSQVSLGPEFLSGKSKIKLPADVQMKSPVDKGTVRAETGICTPEDCGRFFIPEDLPTTSEP